MFRSLELVNFLASRGMLRTEELGRCVTETWKARSRITKRGQGHSLRDFVQVSNVSYQITDMCTNTGLPGAGGKQEHLQNILQLTLDAEIKRIRENHECPTTGRPTGQEIGGRSGVLVSNPPFLIPLSPPSLPLGRLLSLLLFHHNFVKLQILSLYP